MRPRDTSPEAWEFYLELVRKLTPGERIERAFEITKFVYAMCEAGLRQRHPNAGDREIFLRRAQMTLGDELFQKVYGAEFAALS
jgi:hypothetical protein